MIRSDLFAGNLAKTVLLVTVLVTVLWIASPDRLAAGETEPLMVTPAFANVGEMAQDSNESLRFVISNASDSEVRLIYIFAQCDCSMNVPDSGIVPAWGSFVLHAELTLEDVEVGDFDEQITILTDHRLQKELKIPISTSVTKRQNNNTWQNRRKLE